MANHQKRRNSLMGVALWVLVSVASWGQEMVLINEDIIGERAVYKMNALGDELYQKAGIGVYVVALQSLDGRVMHDLEVSLLGGASHPYAILMLAKEEKQVNILTSSDMPTYFDKEAVLSPYPWTGTILPLLTGKKGKDNYSAAMLNGYADIVEQTAGHLDLELHNALGSSNKNTMNILRIVVYAILVWAILMAIIRRKRRNHESKR
jgi:hypothetical protein